MATITLYDISIGQYIGALTVLSNILRKASSHPDAASFPAAALIDDMKPLSFHVQSVSNTVSRSLPKILGHGVESWEDNETTLEELIDRADKTLSFLKGLEPTILEGKETVQVKLPAGLMNGKEFILNFALPNVYFHLQTTYAILRSRGVPLGKDDYIQPWYTARD